MRTVIAGASSLGQAAARQFIDAGHEVVLIDRNRERLDALADTLDCGLMHGDVTLPTILREAAGDAPDTLLALTNSDEDNILCAVVGRSVGFRRVVPQILQVELTSICDELQLDRTITPTETVAARLLDDLEEKPAETAHEARLSGALRLVSYEVRGGLDGCAAGDAGLGDQARVVAVRRNDKETLAHDGTTLSRGDALIFVAARDAAEGLLETLREEDDA